MSKATGCDRNASMLLAFICLALMLCLPIIGFAKNEGKSTDWNALTKVSVGQQLRIIHFDYGSHEGKFVSFTPERVLLSSETGPISCEKKKVMQITVQNSCGTFHNLLIADNFGSRQENASKDFTSVQAAFAEPIFGQLWHAGGSKVIYLAPANRKSEAEQHRTRTFFQTLLRSMSNFVVSFY